MLSIDVKHLACGVLMTITVGVASAATFPFRILQDPVLGLRYDAKQAKFDPMPDEVFSLCRSLVVGENVTAHYWIFGTTRDAARTYYVIGGYSEDLHPEPGYPRYEKDELGAIVYVQGGECRAIDPAREVFDSRDFDEISQASLQQLANDVVARLVRGFGGKDKLRIELRNQRIDQEQLPTELRTALAPYFGK
jgi:hypothetical protein